MSAQAGFHGQGKSLARPMIETVRESLTKELSMRKAQLFKCTEALDGLLIKGMSLKIFQDFFDFFKGRGPAGFSSTQRPTYVLKDFPEDYIPIDKKTTTHHHYFWIQNILWARLGPVRVHVRWGPCPLGSMSAGVHVRKTLLKLFESNFSQVMIFQISGNDLS